MRARLAALLLLAGILTVPGISRAEGESRGSLRERLSHWLDPRCLTPEVGRVLHQLQEQGVFREILPAGFAIDSVGVSDRVVITLRNSAGELDAIELRLPESGGWNPAGQGPHFRYFWVAPGPASGESSATLLALARRIDQAIPQSAMPQCSREPVADSSPRDSSGSGREARYPLSLALASATAQVIVVLLTIGFALVATGSRSED